MRCVVRVQKFILPAPTGLSGPGPGFAGRAVPCHALMRVSSSNDGARLPLPVLVRCTLSCAVVHKISSRWWCDLLSLFTKFINYITVFFSHNKSTNIIFNYSLSTQRYLDVDADRAFSYWFLSLCYLQNRGLLLCAQVRGASSEITKDQWQHRIYFVATVREKKKSLAYIREIVLFPYLEENNREIKS